MVCLADSHEAAEKTFKGSQMYQHLVTLQRFALKDVDPTADATTTLVGTPDLFARNVAEIRDAGVDHLCGIDFAADDVEQLRDQMCRFAKDGWRRAFGQAGAGLDRDCGQLHGVVRSDLSVFAARHCVLNEWRVRSVRSSPTGRPDRPRRRDWRVRRGRIGLRKAGRGSSPPPASRPGR